MLHPETVIARQIWSVRYKVQIGPLSIPARSTIVKLTDGELWLCSPPKPAPELIAALAQLGPMGYVVAPNLQHHLFFATLLAHLPDAEGVVAPGLGAKILALGGHRTLSERDWADELTGVFVEGLPVLNETVWIHRLTAALIVTDLLFDFGADHPPLLRLVARLLGVDRRLAMSRTMKFATTTDRIMAHPIDRVVTAHDQIVESDVTEQLAAAFAWLSR